MTGARSADRRLHPRGLTAAASSRLLALLLATPACETAPTTSASPLAPTPPASVPPVTATVTGTVWEHGPGGAVRALARGRFSGFQWTGRSGVTLGWVTMDADGRYELRFHSPATVALYAGNEQYQPCTALFAVEAGPVTRDLHVFTPDAELGTMLPPELLAEGVLLTGTVYESVADRRVPIAGASIYLDGEGGLGVALARTRTDASGRYLICGSSFGERPGLDVRAPGFRPAEVYGTALSPGATVDVELRR